MAHIPFGASGNESWSSLVESAPISHFIVDRPIVNLLNLPNIMNATGPADLVSQGTGTPALSEINSSEICGFTLDADNESYGHLWILPVDIDLSRQIDFRCLWSNSQAAGTGSAKFIVLYTALQAGQTAIAVGATALDTIISDQADLAANVLQWTDWGTIAARKSGIISLIPGDDALALKVKVDLSTITNATLYQLQARYYRKYVL